MKDFDNWNIKKKNIHAQKSGPFCHSREVWRCSLGVNVGDEQDGTGECFDRPVVVIRGFNEHIFRRFCSGKNFCPRFRGGEAEALCIFIVAYFSGERQTQLVQRRFGDFFVRSIRA